jgi:hypothetical protein
MAATTIQGDLEAVQQFLAAQLPTLGAAGSTVLENQHANFMARIGKVVCFTAEHATALTTAVNLGPWTDTQKAALCNAVVAKLSTQVDGGNQTLGRRSNQEMQTFFNYLTEEDKAAIQDEAAPFGAKLQHACQRAFLIGLEIPTEHSIKHIVAVVCFLGARHLENDHEGLFNMVTEYKRWMKSFKVKHIHPSAEFITQYPPSPSGLPDTIYKHAYKSSQPCMFDETLIGHIRLIESRVPLRRSNQFVRPFQAGQAHVPVAAGLQHGGHNAQANMFMNMFGNYMMGQMGLAVNNSNPCNIRLLAPTPPRQVMPAAIADASKESPPTPVTEAIVAAPKQHVPGPTDNPIPPQSTTAMQQMTAFVNAVNNRNAAHDEQEDVETSSEKAPPTKPRKNGKNEKATGGPKNGKKEKATGGPKCKSKPVKKKDCKAATSSSGSKKWHVTVQGLVTKSVWQNSKKGCGKCRYTPHCTPSCWALRGVHF